MFRKGWSSAGVAQSSCGSSMITTEGGDPPVLTR